jgi:hypothetical protein
MLKTTLCAVVGLATTCRVQDVGCGYFLATIHNGQRDELVSRRGQGLSGYAPLGQEAVDRIVKTIAVGFESKDSR